ncbi:Ig-like domain (group 2) [Lachnospiraceae bacterium XBB1006]|nr:Ig-like domain (group 2) [Lachnospiraceae bacterium XBB1006]
MRKRGLAWLLLAVMLLSVFCERSINAEGRKSNHVLTMNAKKLTMRAGCRTQLYITSGYYEVKLHSTNTEIATINRQGIVKAKKAGKVTIVAKDSYSGAQAKCKITVKKKLTQKQIRQKIYGLKDTFPEGKRWTNANTDQYGNGGCYAFMVIAQEHVFGTGTLTKQHTSFKKVRAGDHIRIGNYHSVVVLKKKTNSVIVVEGNYNSSIHWGREITVQELRGTGFYVETRVW